MVLLAAFASLRWGELAALQRCDIDLAARTIRVQRQLTETTGNGLAIGPPKSAAGLRTVPMPGAILPDLTSHLAIVGPAASALIFTSPEGTSLRYGNFHRRIWQPALSQADLTGVHFHDLRHAGNHYTASAGANMRELMDRMGHATARAALIYLHSTDPRQRALADDVDKAIRAELRKARKKARPRKAGNRQHPIWHGCGTRRQARSMKIIRVGRETRYDLRRRVGAPSATRTRDLLLRRSSAEPS